MRKQLVAHFKKHDIIQISAEGKETIHGIPLDDFILVSDDEIRSATRLMIEKTRNLVEGASAAGMAAALKIKDRLAGKRVALMCSGGNLSLKQLGEILH